MPSAFGIGVLQINNLNYYIGKTMPALKIRINLIFKGGIFYEFRR
jgi:hypothetical protein